MAEPSDVLAHIAREEHLPEPLPPDPFPFLTAWLARAERDRIAPNPNAMTLATRGPDGAPAARIVLCKAIEPDPGYLVFYTNYESRKGRDLDAHPRAAIVFHWDALDRQARIEGPVVRSPAAESDAYFATRPWESRIGAWASRQSEPLASRQALLDQVAEAAARFGIDESAAIPRPPHWGGYRLWAQRIELWVGGVGRIHDRAAWTRSLQPASDGFVPGPWKATRLQP